MSKKEKLYFRNSNAEICYDLDSHIRDAKNQGLKEVTLLEAELDKDDKCYFWCTIYEVVDRCECTKKSCQKYSSKSGRGVCENRGKLYTHGTEVTFKIND